MRGDPSDRLTAVSTEPRAAGHRPPGTPPGPLDTLSVVVPVYNEQTRIRTSLEALFASAATAGMALDVVVVDDGSTDGTPEVLADLAREHGIRVVTQANAGRVAARTTGLAAARGPWLLLLDSRVVVEPDALRWIRAHLAELRTAERGGDPRQEVPGVLPPRGEEGLPGEVDSHGAEGVAVGGEVRTPGRDEGSVEVESNGHPVKCGEVGQCAGSSSTQRIQKNCMRL